ncbi:MAG TPA: hypothetical protein VEQ85_11140, partial [Lacipirellulaceae bacterium]|nr:hypothetical protein [Lacipirellulaceae bacterium]
MTRHGQMSCLSFLQNDKMSNPLMPFALSVTLAALALQSDPTSAGASERDGNAAIAAPLTAEQIAEGWISLFDGE